MGLFAAVSSNVKDHTGRTTGVESERLDCKNYWERERRGEGVQDLIGWTVGGGGGSEKSDWKDYWRASGKADWNTGEERGEGETQDGKVVSRVVCCVCGACFVCCVVC